MTQYAKLIDGALHICAPRHISNPSDTILEDYALVHGFKPIIKESQPHRLAISYYRETDKQIRLSWKDPNLEDARNQVISEINEEKNRILSSTQMIEVDGKQYDFNAEAISNLQGVLLAELNSVEWTLYDYSLVVLDREEIMALMQAFLQAKQAVYTWQARTVLAVKNSETVETLAAINTLYTSE